MATAVLPRFQEPVLNTGRQRLHNIRLLLALRWSAVEFLSLTLSQSGLAEIVVGPVIKSVC